MQTRRLFLRSLTYYWRTNLAVVAGVAVTVAVLAGALVVGDSVRASLRELVLLRLGHTAYVVAGDGFFREGLADELRNDPAFAQRFTDAAPLVALTGITTHDKSRQRASGVLVYGVDQRFWRFHGLEPGEYALDAREVWLSEALAREFGAAAGDALLVRVQKYSAVPLDSLHAQKDDIGRTLRLRVRGALPAEAMGEFSLRPQQGAVRAVFVPLERLQRDLEQPGRINGILVAETSDAAEPRTEELAALIRSHVTLEDLGLRLRAAGHATIVESERILLNDRVVEAARQVAGRLGAEARPVVTYLANTIRVGEREIPYSLVAALEPAAITGSDAPAQDSSPPPLWLNRWAQEELRARPGDRVTLEYYLWEESGALGTASAEFTFHGTVPTEAPGLDRSLAPEYPGITDAERVGDWNPPFPIDLRRVRDRDEKYWDLHRTTPKAFLPLAAGQRLWGSRYGSVTSVRLLPPAGTSPGELRAAAERELRAALDPLAAGMAVFAARAEGMQASRGAVDFGEYFFYFSFFLVVSAVLLTGLFFKLGVEQRLREIGLLEAVGFDNRRIARLFLAEGALLALAGSAAGLAGAVGYGALMVHGLRTWWSGAVGTTYLGLHVTPLALLYGLAGGVATALLCILWALREAKRASPRSLLMGAREPAAAAARPRRAVVLGAVCGAAGLVLLAAAATGAIGQTAGFFGAGALWLIALLSLEWAWLARPQPALLAGTGRRGLARLGFRNAAWRPGRSLLCIALVASATFVLVAGDAFRRDTATAAGPDSGTGGYPLLAESQLPIPYDLRRAENRAKFPFAQDELELLSAVNFVSLRLRPGEDVSCLNLYVPQDPRILGVPPELVRSGRFAFQSSLAETDAERENPWLLLERTTDDGAVPAIADATSLTYVLHRKVGEELTVRGAAGEEVRLRIVAALRDSIFQSELLVSEENFLRLFAGDSDAAGYRFFLLEAPQEQTAAAAAVLEEALSDFGFDAQGTAERLAGYHRVENTYLATFQFLGGLGLLLGTLGLAAVMLRNVLERRRELALLRAVGYRPRHLAFAVVAENALLLVGGLAAGVVAAGLAIAPALAERGGGPSMVSLGVLLAAVMLTGLAASLAAVAAVTRAPLLEALRAE